MQIQKPRQGYKLVKSIFGKYEEIPEEWELINFNDLVFFQEGPGLRHWQFREHGMKVINVTNLVNDFLDVNNTNRYIDLEEFKQNYRHFAIDENDLVLASSGNSYGKVSVVRKQDLPLMMNTSVIRLRTKSKNLNNKYMEFFLKSIFFKKQIDLLITGAAQPNFGPSHLKQIRLKLPPINEQQKIASILSNVDSLIQQTQKEIEQTQRLKKGLMQKLLTRGIGHTKFKQVTWNYGKLLEIPENWNVVLLDKVAKRGSGHTPDAKVSEYYNGGIKWISLADSNKLDNVYISETEKEISEKGIENSSAVKHPAGIVVLSRDAGVGKSAITTTEMAVSQHFMAWQCSDELNNHFLYYLLQFWKPLFEAIAIGTTIKTIGLPFFKKFKIILPPRKEQDRIALTLLNIDKSLWKLQELKSNFEILKKGLMQKLLTGQIRVKV